MWQKQMMRSRRLINRRIDRNQRVDLKNNTEDELTKIINLKKSLKEEMESGKVKDILRAE